MYYLLITETFGKKLYFIVVRECFTHQSFLLIVIFRLVVPFRINRTSHRSKPCVKNWTRLLRTVRSPVHVITRNWKDWKASWGIKIRWCSGLGRGVYLQCLCGSPSCYMHRLCSDTAKDLICQLVQPRFSNDSISVKNIGATCSVKTRVKINPFTQPGNIAVDGRARRSGSWRRTSQPSVDRERPGVPESWTAVEWRES